MGNFSGGRSSFGGGRRSFGGGDRGGFGGRSRGGFGGGRPSFGGRRDDGPREMFDAVCDNCGKNCQVPFRPTSGKPVYCSDCFETMSPREDRGQRAPREPRHDNQNKIQFDSLNAKLDKIISLLEANAPKVKKPKKVSLTSEEQI